MGHQAHDVAALVHDSGDSAERTVHILRVAEHDLSTRGKTDEGAFVGEPGALAVLHRQDELLTVAAAAGEDGRGVLDPDGDVVADELELPVGPKNTW